MTTDNRTNEPKQTKAKSSQDFVFTEAQVEAACKAHEFTNAFGPERETRMRAALVAAAGATQAQPSSTVDEAALIREAKAEALEEFAGQMATGFNPETLNAERRAIKREARARAAEYREGSET